jgi:hypothetical protein
MTVVEPSPFVTPDVPGYRVPVLALNAMPFPGLGFPGLGFSGLGFLAVGGLQIERFKFQIANSDTQGQRPFQVAATTFANNRRWVATSNQSNEMGP